jgi:hypothetical protein
MYVIPRRDSNISNTTRKVVETTVDMTCVVSLEPHLRAWAPLLADGEFSQMKA